jgi:hypothetical protein
MNQGRATDSLQMSMIQQSWVWLKLLDPVSLLNQMTSTDVLAVRKVTISIKISTQVRICIMVSHISDSTGFCIRCHPNCDACVGPKQEDCTVPRKGFFLKKNGQN